MDKNRVTGNTMEVIAYIETDFPEKFGIPRQSGLVENLMGKIVFEPPYRSEDAVKGLEGYDYIWLLWQFEGIKQDTWSATVKPPRLGGNTTMGVFATRSPYRPNHIGLSSVKLEKIAYTKHGPEIYVSGIDLKNNTPIYDIKPYLPHVDSHPDASGGFAEDVKDYELKVDFPENLLKCFPVEKRQNAIDILKQDPRPGYHDDPNRKYGVAFAGKDIHFRVENKILSVYEVVDIQSDTDSYKVNI